MTTKCAVACGEKLAKSLSEQINYIESSLTVDSDFVFADIEDLVEYIKKDEAKVLDGFDRLVILDSAFNHLYKEKQKALSFLMLQSLMNVLGYTKVELVLLTKSDFLRDIIKDNIETFPQFCYANTDVFLSLKVGIKLLTQVMLGKYSGRGLKNAS